MYRSATTRWWMLAVAWAAIAARDVRAEEALDAFPESAAAVARLASLEKLGGNFRELTSAIGSVAAIGGPLLENGLNEAFQIAGDAGAVDRTQPAYLAAFALEDEKEPVAWLVRTSDEAKLQHAVAKAGADAALKPEQLDGGLVKISRDGRDSFFGHYGPWVFYTHNETVARLLVFDRTQQPTFSRVVEPRAKELLEGGDGAVVINAALLTKKYADKLQALRERVEGQIDSLPDSALGGGGTGGSNPEAIKKMYSDLAGLAFDAANDARWAAVAVNFSAAGAKLTALLGVEKDSGVDQLLAAHSPGPLETLGLLPSGAAIYYGYEAAYGRITNWTREWAKVAYGDTPAFKKLNAAMDKMHEAGLGPAVGSFALNPGGGLVTMKMQQAEHPEKLREALAGYQTASEEKSALFSQKLDFKPNAETYQNHSVDLLTTNFEFADVTDEGQRIGQKLIEKMFGGPQMLVRFTSLEGLSLQVGANDPKHLHKAIDGLGSGEGVLGLEDAFAKTRDELGEDVNLIVLLNAPQLVVDAVALLRDIPPFSAGLAKAPFNFGARPAVSFAGVSLITEPQALRLQLYVPVEQPKGILQIFGQ